MVGTKAMLVAPDGLHPALVDLLVDAAREIHGHQGYFETAGEFPGTAQVDIPVSPFADEHKRFGPSFLHRFIQKRPQGLFALKGRIAEST